MQIIEKTQIHMLQGTSVGEISISITNYTQNTSEERSGVV